MKSNFKMEYLVKHLTYLIGHLLCSVLFLPFLFILACIVRVFTRRRQLSGLRPRLVWGPIPIINLKYWSHAVRLLGYESKTLVYGIYRINSKDDFDLTIDDFPPANRYLRFLKPYIIFAWCLARFDIFNFFFDGGFLASTPIVLFECQLLKLAGKKLILMPYGSDIAVPGYLGIFEEAVLACYPNLRRRGSYTKMRVLYFSKWADFIIRTIQFGFLPQYDFFWPSNLAIDIESWKSKNPASFADGHSGEIIVVHSSNHRLIKGTDDLIKAVSELQKEGFKIRLVLFEGRPNEEVRAAISTSDIVAEQFIGGYALAAVEGMCAEKPVLSNLSWHSENLIRNSYLKDCPIVDTTIDKIKDNLRKLIVDPELRHSLGKSGREYVLKYHSYEAIGEVWDEIFEHVWQGTPIDYVWANQRL